MVKTLRKRVFFQKQQRDPIEDLAKHLYRCDTYLTPWEQAADDIRESFMVRAQTCAAVLLGHPHTETNFGVRSKEGRVYSGYRVPQETIGGDTSFSYTVTRYPRLTIVKEFPESG